MALSESTLKTAIQDVLDSEPASASEAANGIAGAYADYCSAALFGTSTPTFTTQEATFAATLLAGMTGTFSAFASAIESGVIAFWTGVPVAGDSGAGTTTPPADASTIASYLTYSIGTEPYQETTADVATLIASILHSATMTTTATLTIPPAGPVVWPIT